MNNAIYTPTIENRKARYARFVSSRIAENYKFPLLLILLHLPLGIFLYNAGSLGLIHPFAVFVIGMRRALLVQERLERVAFIAAYIIGVEVLWRMADVPVFWEFGKYASSVIMITALLRRGLWTFPAFAVFYFLLLLPSCFITLTQVSLDESKAILSSNLSGPLLLFISCWFFSHLKLNQPQIRKLILGMIVPLLSVAVATLFYTVTTPEIEFSGESNFATSGGFGPNQVSSMLGLGAFLSIACFLLFKNSLYYSIFFGVLALLFTAQSVLTFSRGGMYNAVGAIVLMVIFQMRNVKEGIRRLLPVLAISFIFVLLVFPYLDNFTGGALKERFEDSDPTNRGAIVKADLQIFAENPVLGVGVGNAYEERAKFLDYKAMSHTEFGRIIAEHGIFGLFAMGAMGLMVVFSLRKQDSNFGKAFVIGFMAWSVLFMLNAGMRLAAPSFIWGMSYLIIANFQARKRGMRQIGSRPSQVE